MTEDPDHIWERFEAHLRSVVATSAYEIWLARLRLVRVDPGALVVAAPHELHAWIAERYARPLDASAVHVLGAGARVRVMSAREVDDDRGPAAPGARAPALTGTPDDLNPKYTFDQFVIGDANRFAHGAALAVAELPGQAYNPLFVYGPPGVGKTHLLHAIGNYVRAYGEGLSVRYTTVETFTNEFVAALRGGDMDRFKDRYRHVGVLLIDDVQFLASKAKTEDEFFHTFNALHAAGSQLVLTSDRLPRDLGTVEDRLRDRFQAGLVTAIEPPDLSTRMAVLRKRVLHDDIRDVDDAVLELIADRVRVNVRALEGALIRVVAFASLRGKRLTPELARAVLDELYPEATRTHRRARRPRGRRPHSGPHGRGLRRHARRPPRPRPCGAAHVAASGRHVPRPRAHAGDASRHRRPLPSQPHDRAPRLPAHRRAPRRRPRGRSRPFGT